MEKLKTREDSKETKITKFYLVFWKNCTRK